MIAPRVHVLQISDTLEAGGAERVAVNLANTLPRSRYVAHLCTTRRDGPLESLVSADVPRLRLARTGRWEIDALLRLAAYNREHKIAIMHAHETSLFIAVLASLLPPYPKVIWHDHFGRHAIEERPLLPYRVAAARVSGVVAVNPSLAAWSTGRLRIPAHRVRHISNFVARAQPSAALPELPGEAGMRLVCVANLRPEKDHLTLLRAMEQLVRHVPTAHLLLVGTGTIPEYSTRVRDAIAERALGRHVSLLGQRDDVPAILRQCAIGVLSSASEGCPLALLEYGMAGLPVVATRVGQCGEVLDEGRAGFLVSPGAPDELAQALLQLLRSPEQRAALGQRFQARVDTEYGEGRIVAEVCEAYESALRG